MQSDAMLGSPSGRWFVLHTLSNHEKVVAAHLEGREVQHFLPSYKVTRTRCDRRVTLDLPLFPGYVFARFERSQQLSVLTVPGMLRILAEPGGLATIGDADVLRLREGLVRNLKMLPASPYSVGDKVKILWGPFQGYEAFVIESKARVIRVVMSLGSIKTCSFSLDVPPSHLELLCNYPIMIPIGVDVIQASVLSAKSIGHFGF